MCEKIYTLLMTPLRHAYHYHKERAPGPSTLSPRAPVRKNPQAQITHRTIAGMLAATAAYLFLNRYRTYAVHRYSVRIQRY